MKKSNKKFWIWGSIGVLIIIILIIAKKQGWIGIQDITRVSVETVEKRDIFETVSANGKIQPEVEVIINPDASGEIIEIYVKEGDEVKKGDLLAKINPEIYQSYYDRAVASLNGQKANVANSKARFLQVTAQFISTEASYNRNKKLWEQKVISDAEYETALAAFQVAKAEVEAAKQAVSAADFTVLSAEASMKEARENLLKTAVFTPIDGTVSKMSKEKGERVAGASQFSAGTEIMRIAKLNSMEVEVKVSENEIVRVNLNDTAIVEVDAFINRKFKGIVTEIANSADITGIGSDQVTNFAVKIRILPESYLDLIQNDKQHISPFRPGMSATVDVQTEIKLGVLTVPIQAVTARSDTAEVKNNKKRKKDLKEEEEKQENAGETKKSNAGENFEYVFVFDNGKAKMTRVKTGIQNDTYIEILEGLKDKQEIISGPYRAINKKLNNGMEVQKVEKDKLFEKE